MVPPQVDETVSGVLDKLPGCNSITSGPESAKPESRCGATTTISDPQEYYTDLTSSKGWKYMGCVTDNVSGRMLTGYSTSSSTMTIEECVDTCAANGYSVAGTEYSSECYCGNSIPSTGAPIPGYMGNCMLKCSGNNLEYCGGYGTISLYEKCTSGSCHNVQFGPSSSNTASSSPPTAPARRNKSGTCGYPKNLGSSTMSTAPSTTLITDQASGHRHAHSSFHHRSSTTTAFPSPSIISSAATPSSIVASSTSTASGSSSTSSTARGMKRGLAYDDASLTKDFVKSGSQLSWAYNWYSSTSGLSADFEYVPMLWGLNSSHTDCFKSDAATAIKAGSKHILAFNEPDLSSQSDLSPSKAAAGYKQYIEPFSSQAKLGSPAVSNGGLDWLTSFLSECSNCTIDFVAIHWYDSATNFAYFKNYIEQVHKAVQKPIWITEMGASGSTAEQITFLQTVMPWLDSLEYVERYAYFGVFNGYLVDGSSQSPLGQTFATYTSDTVTSAFSS